MAALIERKTWSQADLSRAVGLERPEALRNVLRELVEIGVPLESEKAHPHVYWRVRRDWVPGGVLFKTEHVASPHQEMTTCPLPDCTPADIVTFVALGSAYEEPPPPPPVPFVTPSIKSLPPPPP
jgi:hypothetical protein